MYQIHKQIDGSHSIFCFNCGKMSYNINDVINRYCSYCKKFFTDADYMGHGPRIIEKTNDSSDVLQGEWPPDKKILLKASDGPEIIEIYTSELESGAYNSQFGTNLFLTVTTMELSFHVGPFQLNSILEQLKKQIKADF